MITIGLYLLIGFVFYTLYMDLTDVGELHEWELITMAILWPVVLPLALILLWWYRLKP